MPKRKKSRTQYQFKVRLKARRSVWRSVVLRGDQTLDDLHGVIFSVFDRYDEHLYSFFFPKASWGRTQPGKRPLEYTAPQGFQSMGVFGTDGLYNAAETTLDDLGLTVGQSFEYLFDFGDEWWHELKVETISAIEDGGTYPWIVEKRGSSPPQYPGDDE